jgi:hypothetical protein
MKSTLYVDHFQQISALLFVYLNDNRITLTATQSGRTLNDNI